MAEYVANPMREPILAEPVVNLTRVFHQRLPGYAPTPLLDLHELAGRVGVGRLWLKDESARLDSSSFEILGASWGLYRSLLERSGRRPARWQTLAELLPSFEHLRPLHVAVVGDDGFALAVARAARAFEIEATVYAPAAIAHERRAALEREGASIVTVDGGFDDAVVAATAAARDEHLVLSDSSWPDFEDVPRWVTDAYVTVFEEADEELSARGAELPDAVVVPLGTGALAAAAARYFRTSRFADDLRLIGVEPAAAPCFSASVTAGERRALAAPAATVMGDLGRGRPSPLAFQHVARAFDGFVAITDDEATEAVAELGGVGVATTPSGAAALAGLRSLPDPARAELGLGPSSSALVIDTEGPLHAPI